MPASLKDLKIACQEQDNETQKIGFAAYIKKHDVSIDDLMYIAEQRALRAVLVLTGKAIPQGTDYEKIRLTPAEQKLMPVICSAFMDGFLLAKRVEEKK